MISLKFDENKPITRVRTV